MRRERVAVLTINTTDRRAVLRLPDRADVSSAVALHEILLRAHLDAIDSVNIDAGEVAKLDAAVLQLLVAWLNSLNAQHIPWHWQAASETFNQVVALAGLTEILRLANERSDENSGN